jgi:hypothetical protein
MRGIEHEWHARGPLWDEQEPAGAKGIGS